MTSTSCLAADLCGVSQIGFVLFADGAARRQMDETLLGIERPKDPVLEMLEVRCDIFLLEQLVRSFCM